MRTLLLADDSITIQRVIALTFAEQDFRVITVSDGQQAIDRIAAQRPDIVLAGTTMPGMNGYEVSAYVRSQPALKNVPVLLLTGAFETVDEELLKKCGASGTLEKPFESTIVISRVKELLGMKGDAKPTPASGRPGTSADSAAAKRPPRPPVMTSKPAPRAAAASAQPAAQKPAPPAPPKTPPKTPAKTSAESWDELREESGLDAGTRSVEGGAHEPDRADYLDSLDSAFDTLDARLSSRPGNEGAAPRNPDPPVRRSGGPADPRSPGRLPTPKGESAPANSVFEVDDQWFAEGDQARAESRAEQRQLAAEMGIHDVELPETDPSLHAAPAKDLDFDFGLDAVRPKAEAIDVHEEMTSAMDGPAEGQQVTGSPATPSNALRPAGNPVAPPQAKPLAQVADRFAAMLAHEQGEPHAHPLHEEPAPVIVQAAAPEITDAMLDQIAERVADRLNGSLFADHLRAAMAATVRDTVRSVVSETSEKLVRDEIARVKAQAERDTQ